MGSGLLLTHEAENQGIRKSVNNYHKHKAVAGIALLPFLFNCSKIDSILFGLAGGHNPPKADKDKTAAYLLSRRSVAKTDQFKSRLA